MPLHLINIRDSVNQISVPLDYHILALNYTFFSLRMSILKYYVTAFLRIVDKLAAIHTQTIFLKSSAKDCYYMFVVITKCFCELTSDLRK